MVQMIKIENIYWERANLHFLFDKKISQNLYITNNNTRIKLEKQNDKEKKHKKRFAFERTFAVDVRVYACWIDLRLVYRQRYQCQ